LLLLAAFVVPGHSQVRKQPWDSLDVCQAEYDKLFVRFVEGDETVEGVKAIDASEVLIRPGTPQFYKTAATAVCLVVLAALAAGLTMGLVSIDHMEMEIIVKTEEKDMPDAADRLKLKQDQAAARKVLPLIQDHHKLLVTLLLLNSIANETLPLFLDAIVPSWLAVVLSVSLLLVFGEILPSAIFTGSEQLRIASKFAPFVRVIQFLLFPIAWPIAKLLDCVLGADHKGRYNFAELRAIVGIHTRLHQEPEPVLFESHDAQSCGIIQTSREHHFTHETAVCFVSTPKVRAVSTQLASDGSVYYVKPCPPLRGRDKNCTLKLYRNESRTADSLITFKQGELMSGAFLKQERDELKIMEGVIKLTHMVAHEAMLPLSKVDMIEKRTRLTHDTMKKILKWGHSRLPVYDVSKHNIRGFILVKKLIVTTPSASDEQGLCVEDIGLDEMVIVPPHIPMLELLNKFQEKRRHLALVTDSPKRVSEAWANHEVIPVDVHMMGIITLEDVIEKMLQENIEDESDAIRRVPSNALSLPARSPLTAALSPSPASRATSDPLSEPLLDKSREIP